MVKLKSKRGNMERKLTELEIVRREKLNKYKEMGIKP